MCSPPQLPLSPFPRPLSALPRLRVTFLPLTRSTYNQTMPRTFSLQRLMLAITLICIACSIAVAYPQESLAYALLLSLFTPTVIVCQILVSLSSPDQRMTTLLIALFGAFLTLIFALPVMDSGLPRPTVWKALGPYVLPITIGPTVGALGLGGAALLDDILRLRHRP